MFINRKWLWLYNYFRKFCPTLGVVLDAQGRNLHIYGIVLDEQTVKIPWTLSYPIDISS